MMRLIKPSVGGDPEFFLQKGGHIIGSEKVIPEDGLKGPNSYTPNVVRDGIQVELNPDYAYTIPDFGNNLRSAFILLSEQLKKFPGVTADFTGTIDVSREEFESLNPFSRILGCKPSKNVYGDRPILVDGQTYMTRSAGGHNHYGIAHYGTLTDSKAEFIATCDIVVGNTMVMLDRNLRSAERRENYGRAGEYREPEYGVEYRTLSNFWLKNYSLMDFVYGMGYIAAGIKNDPKLVDELAEVANMGNFIKAIDTNDWDLARANFESIRPFLVKHLPKGTFVLDAENIDRFLVFAGGVQDKGLEHFFPQEPVAHWVEGKFEPFRDFLKRLY